jgi:high-affinity K+ transport system ATPase subunit B
MLTGDHHQIAEKIATDLGLTHFLAEILPAQKASEIQKLQHDGKKQVATVRNGLITSPPSRNQMSELRLEQEQLWRRRPLRIS